jgi:chromosome segregation ATPase
MSGFYINERKNIYACEKNELIAKIDELSMELVNTKTNLGEHIDYLNNYIIQLENKYKQQIVDLTLQNSNNLRSNTIKQDTRVKELESELSIEKEKNEKLKKKLEEYEQELKNKKNDIEKLSDEKVYMNDAKKASEERLRQKISSLEKTHSDELNKMKSDYENELSKIKSELDETKMNYFKMTEESKGNLDKMMNDRNKEKLYYDNIINNLKQDIANKTFENEKLSNITKNLQQDNDVLNEKVNQMNDEIYSKEQEQQEMLKKMNKIKEEKNDYARKNSQLNSVVYGRFKKIVKNKV